MEIRILRRVDRLAAESSTAEMRVVAFDVAPPPGAPAALLDALGWWESKAAGALPDRSALDPVEIRRHLSCVALLDVEQDDFRFRLVGEEVRARYGALRGRSICEALMGNARAETLAEHRACAAGRQPTLARRSEPTCDGTDQRRFWRLLLPFGEDKRTTAILSLMHFDSSRPAR